MDSSEVPEALLAAGYESIEGAESALANLKKRREQMIDKRISASSIGGDDLVGGMAANGPDGQSVAGVFATSASSSPAAALPRLSDEECTTCKAPHRGGSRMTLPASPKRWGVFPI